LPLLPLKPAAAKFFALRLNPGASPVRLCLSYGIGRPVDYQAKRFYAAKHDKRFRFEGPSLTEPREADGLYGKRMTLMKP
jgi:hypothetical protein